MSQTVSTETIVVTSPATEPTTARRLGRLARKNPLLKVLPEEGEGFAAAINTGIRAGMAPRIGFLLSDDWLDERAVETCLPFDTDIVSTGMCVYTGNGRQIIESASRSPSMEEFDGKPTLAGKASYLKHFLLFRKAKLLEVGGVDETVGLTGPDDFDLPWTLLERGATVSIVPDRLYNYRDHAGDRLTLRDAEAQVVDLLKILDKHGVHGREREDIVGRHSQSYGRLSRETANLRAVSHRSGSAREKPSP